MDCRTAANHGRDTTGYRDLVNRKRPAWMRQKEAELGDKASRNGFPYLAIDHEVLAIAELSITEKALLLHRKYSATSAMCARHGYSSRRETQPRDAGDWLIDLAAEVQSRLDADSNIGGRSSTANVATEEG